MTKDRPTWDPEAAGKVKFRYDKKTGRVIDEHPDPIRPDEIFDYIPYRRHFGPLTHGMVHNPRFGNIFIGVPESKTHHNKFKNRARLSGDFWGPDPE